MSELPLRNKVINVNDKQRGLIKEKVEFWEEMNNN